jgi:hypothetical protein
MRYIFAFETSYHVQNGIRASYVSKELIAETFPIAGSFHQTGYVHNLQLSLDNFFADSDGCKSKQTFIRNTDASNVGLYGAKWVI